jgi:hypothetical protein
MNQPINGREDAADQICARPLNTIQVSKSAEAQHRTIGGFGNPRHSRFGNLRYDFGFNTPMHAKEIERRLI